MAFDDLTPSQRDALIPLIEALLTGKYNEEFFLTRQAGRRQGEIHLTYKHSKSGGQGLPGFTESEVQAFKEAGYITTSTNFSAALKIKAYREYEEYAHKPSEESDRMSNLDVFISHSSRDKEVASAIIDLLRAALNMPADKIRCTSVDGYRLPAGASTDEQLRQEIYDARTFIGLITPTSLQSTYVLFELGARWGARRHLAPVLASGADANALRQPLASLNALSCEVAAQVYQLVGDIAGSLKISANNPPAYQRHVEALIQASIDGRGRNRSQSMAGGAAAEASAFTPSEEVGFRHIHKMLNRGATVKVGVFQNTPDGKSSSKVRTEVLRYNLLAALSRFLNDGYDYYDYHYFVHDLSRWLQKERPLTNPPDATLHYSNAEVAEDIKRELQRYGLARHTTRTHFERQESAYEFTEKMHSFIYWLEVNSLIDEKVSFELVESHEG